MPPAMTATDRHRPLSRWRRVNLPLLGLVLVPVVVLVPLLGENGLAVYFGLRAQRDEMRRDVTALQSRADSLRTRIEALATDPVELERLARERYNMRRDGEEVLLIVPEPAAR
jgi:cell division protein FtsB